MSAARSLLEEAETLEAARGPAAGRACHEQIVDFLDAEQDPQARSLRIRSLNSLAETQEELGDAAGSMVLTQKLLRDHLEAPPPEAADIVVHAAQRHASMLMEQGEAFQAVRLLDRALDFHGEQLAQNLSGYGPELLCWVLITLSEAHEEAGDATASGAAVQRLLDLFLDSPPESALELVLDAALRRARLLGVARRRVDELALLDDLLNRFGGPDGSHFPRLDILANFNAAVAAGEMGDRAQAIERFAAVVRLLPDPRELADRRMLADALEYQAGHLLHLDRQHEAVALCHDLIERFGNESDAEILESVLWAQRALASVRDAAPRRSPRHGA